MAHVIWDWNGTLLADQHEVLAGVNTALGALGAASITMDTYRQVPKRPVRRFYGLLVDRPLSADEWHLVDETYHVAYAERVARAKLATGAAAVLTAAGARHSQSLLSMWPHTDLVPLVRRHGLAAHFRHVEGHHGACGGEKAEHLAGHVTTLDRDFGVPAAECVVVGDTVDDAVAASEVGVAAVLVLTDSYAHERLAGTGAPVVPDLPTALATIDRLTSRAGRY